MRRAKEMVHTGQSFSWRRFQGCRDLPEKGKSIVEEREAGSGRVSAPSLVCAGAGLHLFKPKSSSSCMSVFCLFAFVFCFLFCFSPLPQRGIVLLATSLLFNNGHALKDGQDGLSHH